MPNIVMLYTAREGSSAITEAIKAQQSVSVPVFEDLDQYHLEQEFGSITESQMARALHHTLQRGMFDPSWLLDAQAPDLDHGAGSHNPVFFKWRPWGDFDAVARIFSDTNTSALILLRRDLLNLALSFYYSDHVMPKVFGDKYQGHVQFLVAAMPPDEQGLFIERVRNHQFDVDPHLLRKIVEDNIYIRRPMLQWASLFQKNGIQNKTIFYEDFLADPAQFLTEILEALGTKNTVDIRDLYLKKVNRPDLRSQVSNISHILHAPDITKLMKEWEEFLKEIDGISAPL